MTSTIAMYGVMIFNADTGSRDPLPAGEVPVHDGGDVHHLLHIQKAPEPEPYHGGIAVYFCGTAADNICGEVKKCNLFFL